MTNVIKGILGPLMLLPMSLSKYTSCFLTYLPIFYVLLQTTIRSAEIRQSYCS